MQQRSPKTKLWQMGGYGDNINGFEEELREIQHRPLTGWSNPAMQLGSQVKSGYACSTGTCQVLYVHKGWRN